MAKTAKATKPEKEKRERTISGYPKSAKITVLVKENPKREGTNAHAAFAKYRNGMTIAQYLEAGGRPAEIAWDLKLNYIKIAA